MSDAGIASCSHERHSFAQTVTLIFTASAVVSSPIARRSQKLHSRENEQKLSAAKVQKALNWKYMENILNKRQLSGITDHNAKECVYN